METIKLGKPTSDTLCSLATQNEAVRLILQTVLDTLQKEGEYVLQGKLILVKKED